MRRSCMRSCGPGGRDRAAEVRARRVGVVALGGAGAEDRLRGRLELLLALELLVGALLELLHRGERGALLDLDLSRLGRHRAPERSARRPRRFGHGAIPRLHSPGCACVWGQRCGDGARARPRGAGRRPAGADPRGTADAQRDRPDAVQSTTRAGNGGLKTWQEVLIFAAGIILIGGIAVAILTDSRERAAKIRHGGPMTDPGRRRTATSSAASSRRGPRSRPRRPPGRRTADRYEPGTSA